MTSVDSPPDLPYRPVGELLAAYRRDTPDKTALVDVDRATSITFAELAGAVDAAALQLAAHGVVRGTRVLLLVDQGIEKLILWFAIWRLGAVACPLDLAFLNHDAATKTLQAIGPTFVLYCERDRRPLLPASLQATVLHFGSWPDLAHEPQDHDDKRQTTLRFTLAPGADPATLPAGAAATDLACMGCTSGTTGIPKVIVYDHACYWLNGLASLDMVGLSQADRILEYRSFGWYSAQILSLITFLQTGLTLHVARQFSRSRFYDWIAGYRITACAGVPTVINMLLSQPLGENLDFTSLRVMTCSSAPLSTLQWLRFEQTIGIRLLNLYGSSEAGWICGNRAYKRRIGTVGYPAKYTEFEIVDEHGALCPVAEQGQVTVRGPKLALGVLQADGSLKPIRGTAFRTRDLASMDSEGFVHIAGRTDDLIIRGGIKIAPQEIEDALLAHERILDAAALGVPDPIYGEEIVCFVVATLPGALDEASVLAYCAHHLPREKIPKQVFILASLPRSERDKIMRDTLRQDWWSAAQQANSLDDDLLDGETLLGGN